MIRPAPGIPIEQQPLPVLRRLLLWGETRGESNVGKLAVLCVVANRVAKGGQWKAVILKPKAFSCFNPDDHNREKLLNAHNLEPNSWASVDAVCELWENGAIVDVTQGADHYYSFNIVTPKWGRGHPDWQETVVIGNHVFGICP